MAYKNDRTKNRRRYKTRYRSKHNYKTSRSSSQTKAAVLVSVLTFVVIASVIITFAFGDRIYNALDNALKNNKKPEPTKPIVVSTVPISKPTEPPTEEPTEPQVEQDEAFLSLLELNSISVDELKGSQIIFVDTDEATLKCKLYCYEKDENGVYKQVLNTYDGYVGSEGVAEIVSPYEQKTPVGIFNIEYAVGTNYNPGTALQYSQFKYGDYWITDPSASNYNRWITSYDAGTRSIGQPLWEYTVSYPYALVFDYNRNPTDPAQGCAKFVHVYRYDNPQTKGGIGISQSDLKSILLWLNPDKTPQIAISK